MLRSVERIFTHSLFDNVLRLFEWDARFDLIMCQRIRLAMRNGFG